MFSFQRTTAPTATRMLALRRLRLLARPQPRSISSLGVLAQRRCWLPARTASVFSRPCSGCSGSSSPLVSVARAPGAMSLANFFTSTVVSEMRLLHPEELADRSWDNVGLLLENSVQLSGKTQHHRVLLTNDLTPDVVDEAINYQVSVIIAYHPIIFRGLKSITLKDTQQASLLGLMLNNIAVYCPHTALDAGVNGINAWLASKVTATASELGQLSSTVVAKSIKDTLPEAVQQYNEQGDVIDVGYGRITTFSTYIPAADLIRGVVRAMGLSMSHVLVARPRQGATAGWWRANPESVRNVGVCAGSGFDLFRDRMTSIDMLITGEVSHHDALYATTRGVWVVCLLHSNSERRYLSEVLQAQLTKAIARHGTFPNAAVLVSDRDRDPFEFWDVDNPPRQEPQVAAFSV